MAYAMNAIDWYRRNRAGLVGFGGWNGFEAFGACEHGFNTWIDTATGKTYATQELCAAAQTATGIQCPPGYVPSPRGVGCVLAPATPVPTSTSVPVPSDWTKIADEGGTVNLAPATEPIPIYYGGSGKWVRKDVVDIAPCSNAYFTDPIWGVPKACYLDPDALARLTRARAAGAAPAPTSTATAAPVPSGPSATEQASAIYNAARADVIRAAAAGEAHHAPEATALAQQAVDLYNGAARSRALAGDVPGAQADAATLRSLADQAEAADRAFVAAQAMTTEAGPSPAPAPVPSPVYQPSGPSYQLPGPTTVLVPTPMVPATGGGTTPLLLVGAALAAFLFLK